MKDITQDILNAAKKNVLWSIDLFFHFLEEISKTHIDVSYWKDEENWATIIIDKKPIGYLWKKYPVLFIQEQFLSSLNSILKSYSYLCVITVEDLNAQILKIDERVLKDYFEYGIAQDKFSATDLWFQTNSI